MDIYHIWFNLKDSHRDVEFCDVLAVYMEHLRSRGLIQGHRLTRRKLGFGPPSLGEFHLAIEVKDLAQLDQAFLAAATRTEPIEGPHAAVYSRVTDFTAALYRDFPDSVRVKKAPRKKSG